MNLFFCYSFYRIGVFFVDKRSRFQIIPFTKREKLINIKNETRNERKYVDSHTHKQTPDRQIAGNSLVDDLHVYIFNKQPNYRNKKRLTVFIKIYSLPTNGRILFRVFAVAIALHFILFFIVFSNKTMIYSFWLIFQLHFWNTFDSARIDELDGPPGKNKQTIYGFNFACTRAHVSNDKQQKYEIQ